MLQSLPSNRARLAGQDILLFVVQRHQAYSAVAPESFATYNSFDFAAKGFAHIGRQLGWSKQPPPCCGLKAVIAGLGNRGHVRQRWGTLLTADSNGAQLAPLHVRQHRLQRVEHDLELTANKIGHRWSAAPIGYMLDVDTCSALEHL